MEEQTKKYDRRVKEDRARELEDRKRELWSKLAHNYAFMGDKGDAYI